MRHVEARAGSPLYKNVTSRLRIIRHGYANVSLSVSRTYSGKRCRADAIRCVYRVPCFQIIFKSLARARVPFRIRLSVNELCSLHEATRGNALSRTWLRFLCTRAWFRAWSVTVIQFSHVERKYEKLKDRKDRTFAMVLAAVTWGRVTNTPVFATREYTYARRGIHFPLSRAILFECAQVAREIERFQVKERRCRCIVLFAQIPAPTIFLPFSRCTCNFERSHRSRAVTCVGFSTNTRSAAADSFLWINRDISLVNLLSSSVNVTRLAIIA